MAYCLKFHNFMELNSKGFLSLAEPILDPNYLEDYDISNHIDILNEKLKKMFIIKKCIYHNLPLRDCEVCRKNFTCKHDILLKNCIHCRNKLRYGIALTKRRLYCHKCQKMSVCAHYKFRKNCCLCKPFNLLPFEQLHTTLKKDVSSEKDPFIMRRYCYRCLRGTFCGHFNKRKDCKICTLLLFRNFF